MTTTNLIPFSRLFDGVFAPMNCNADSAHAKLSHRPRTDMLEGDQDYIIRMDLPGVNRDDLNIELDGETLTISADRTNAADEGYRKLRRERCGTESYKRSFELGRRIDREGISASLVNGVLTLTLHKSEQAVARRIEVK